MQLVLILLSQISRVNNYSLCNPIYIDALIESIYHDSTNELSRLFFSLKHPKKIKVVEMNNYLKTYSESHNFTQSYETLKLRNYAHQNEIQFKIFRVAINDTSSLCGVHKLLIAPTTISSVSCGIIMVHIVYIYAIYLLLPWLQLQRS